MTKLHQILAVKTDTVKATRDRLTEAYHNIQKPQLMTGMTRTYQPFMEDGETFPPERQRVQVVARKLLDSTRNDFETLLDLEATIDWANTEAKADVVVDGIVLIKDAPATYLLWLEKELTAIVALASKLPVLDAAEDWTWSSDKGCYVAEPVLTNKTKKVPTVLVKYEATGPHPAQTELINEDKVVGQNTVVKMSGGMPLGEAEQFYNRAVALRAAVKDARARANEQAVEQQKVAKPVLDFLFAGFEN